jgi:hypothetical protein
VHRRIAEISEFALIAQQFGLHYGEEWAMQHVNNKSGTQCNALFTRPFRVALYAQCNALFTKPFRVGARVRNTTLTMIIYVQCNTAEKVNAKVLSLLSVSPPSTVRVAKEMKEICDVWSCEYEGGCLMFYFRCVVFSLFCVLINVTCGTVDYEGGCLMFISVVSARTRVSRLI